MGYEESASRRSKAYEAATAVGRPSPWPRRVLLAILLLAMAGYFAFTQDGLQRIGFGTAQQAGGPSGGRGGFQAPPVRVAVAALRDVPVTVRTIGTVLANSVVTVKSQVDGPLLSAGFREGQMVKKGDLLFRIDPAPFEATVRQAAAQVARDQAQLESAQADAERAVMLAERGIVSTQQRDQLVANAKALAATVAADEAGLERARLNLGYTTIRSPIDGKTGPYIVYPGNQVRANDTAGLITITQIQPVKITFNLPQVNLPQLQARMRGDELIAAVTLRSDMVEAGAATAEEAQEMSIPVKVDFIGNTVDQRSGTIELRATFANPDLRLVPGELIDVSVTLETLNDAVIVPHEALNVGQSGPYVFVIGEGDKTDMRPVNVVYEDSLSAAVGSGVKAGERVVIDGQLRLTPGIAVSVVGAPSGAAPSVASEGAEAPGSSSGATKGRQGG